MVGLATWANKHSHCLLSLNACANKRKLIQVPPAVTHKFRNGFFRIALAISLGILWSPAHAVTAPIGATSGSFSVSPSGAATYSIPIVVPPGTNGMAPKLSLNYDSQSGNGLVGMGWSIGGLSVIHRCGATIAIDGFKGGVNYDANDKFCLDGERLIWSATDSSYHTQHESWQKITFSGSATNPTYFIVKAKDGTVTEYTAQVLAANNPYGIVRLWALSKIQDTSGNVLTINYGQDTTKGDYWPANIVYNGNYVIFDYEGRSDITPAYEGGSVIKTTQHLKTIRSCIDSYCTVNGSLVRSYTLTYDNSGAVERSRLINIKECGSDGVCLSPMVFGMQSNTIGFDPPKYWLPSNGGVNGSQEHSAGYMFTGDFNGDGKTDYMWNNGGWQVALSNGNGFDAPKYWLPSNGGVNGSQEHSAGYMFTGDFNGDGKTDYMWNNGGWQVVTSAGPVSDLLVQMTNGLGVQATITYKPLTDSSVYHKDSGSGYPYQDVQDATYVVAQYTQSDGLGGTNTTTAFYDGLKRHLAANTSSGFSWRSVADPTGLVTTTYYNQTIDGTEGTAYLSLTTAGSATVKSITNSWTPVTLQTDAAGRVQRTLARLASTVEETRELDNSVVTTVNTNYSGYDAYGNPGTITVNFNDGNIKTTTNTYNNDITNWYLGQLTSSQVLSQAPGQPSLTRTSSFAYDGLNRLSSEIIEPNDTGNLKLTTTYGYDAFGNRNKKTVTGADITPRDEYTLVYYGNGQYVYTRTNAAGHVEKYNSYDVYGNVASLTGPNSIPTSWSYDGFGRKIGETRADGSTTTITYQCWDGTTPASGVACPTPVGTNAMYRVYTTASGSGSTYAFYDRLGRVVQTNVRGFGGNYTYTQTNYDNLGRVASASRSEFNSPPTQYTTYIYDDLGRVLTATAPGNRVTTNGYNGLTTTATFTAPNTQTQTKSTVKNSQGKVVSSTDAAGTISYVYDAIGNLLQVTDPLGNISTMTYNIRGFKTAMHDPDMGNWSYTYNALGQLLTQKDAKNQTITMVYNDPLGRMTSRTTPEGTSTWTYDTAAYGKGKLAAVSNSAANESYTYDTLGRPSTATTSIGGVSYAVTTGYDTNSRIYTVAYPETGFTLRHCYDSYGFLNRIENAANATPCSSSLPAFWVLSSVDAMNRSLSETYGNGLIGTHAYDPTTSDLTTIKTGISSNLTSVQSETYGFDGAGNLLSRGWWDGTANRSETFGYDNLNRLKTVTGPVAKTYNYDTIGNITFKSDVGNYTYPASGSSSVRPHAVSGTSNGAVTTTFSYDANGNMLTGNGKTVTYTSFNKAKTIKKGTTTSTLTYDASFNRLIKSNSSGTTVYIGKLYERYTASGGAVTQKHYIYAGNNIIGVYSKAGATTSTRYFHTDSLGSVDIITNETGGVVQRLSYDAWGKRRNTNGTDAASITAQATRGFTAHEHDDEVTLINMNAREYDPIIARFISPDTIVPGALNSQAYNRYSYTLNNPLSYTDPTGNFSWRKAVQNIASAVVFGPSVSIAGAYVASHKQNVANFTNNALYKVSQIKYVGGLMSIGMLTNQEFGLMYGWSTGDWKTVARAHATGTVIAGTYWAGGAAFGQYNAATSACYAQETLAITYAGPIYMAESAGIGYVSNYSMAMIYGASAHEANRAGLNGAFGAIKTAGMRIGFEYMKMSTDMSSMKSGNTLHDPNSGDLWTYGNRPGVDRSLVVLSRILETDGTKNWFWKYDGIRDIFNQVSKVHDWVSSWAYNSSGSWTSYGVAGDTAFSFYSVGTMLPAAIYSMAAHDNGIRNLNQYINNSGI